MSEPVCCGVLEELASKFDLPFEQPLLLKGRELVVGGWAVRLLKKTPVGSISKKGSSFITLSYCPFCGQALR
jgi:hypothetical protein